MTDRNIPILAYHSFTGSVSKAWQYALEPTLLDEHCAYLRERNYFSLTVSECLQSKQMALSSRPVALTFDGAFADFELVLPILNKYQFSATLFVPTGAVGKKSTWLEASQHRPIMDWNALRGLANIEIGSLGHAHLHLTQVSEQEAKDDIERSKRTLEDELGLPCQSFAYPYGETNERVMKLVKEADFFTGCTLQAEISTLEHDPYALPRFAITQKMSLSELIGSKSKSRFSFFDLFRPQRQRRAPPAPPRYIPPPLPTKVTTEQVRQERQQQPAPVRPPDITRPDTARPDTAQARRQDAVTPPLTPRSFRESVQEQAVQQVSDLEQQGDFIADLKTWIAQQQGKHLIEYNMLVGAAERLQASQEAGVFAPERVRAVYQAQEKLEQARTQELAKLTEHQRVRLKAYLEKLNAFPKLEGLSVSVDNAKNIVQEYLDYLSVATLGDDVIDSTEQLVKNLEQRLNASYRSGLQKLVQDATNAKAMDFLVTLQRAGNALDQGTYPDLHALGQSLENIVHTEKSQRVAQQRSQTFVRELSEAARVFETVSPLNNEDVTTVRQLLYYLMSQRDVFPKLSNTMQQELESSLQEAKELLDKLGKDYQATQTVASQLVSEDIFGNLFGEEDKKS
jgi:peptidoglycan/xylan/chitin deacetylase (PgdA/CDA1 family)